MKVLVKKDEYGAFQKGKIEISDLIDLKTLKLAVTEYIEWIESYRGKHSNR